ncbi:MAG: DNA-binding protein [Nanoarchaeota archaeon]
MNIDDPNELAKAQQIEQIKKQVLSVMLSKEAYERLSRIRSANPQLAAQIELYMVQIFQSGRFDQRITDDKMKEILIMLSEKKEFNITRK